MKKIVHIFFVTTVLFTCGNAFAEKAFELDRLMSDWDNSLGRVEIIPHKDGQLVIAVSPGCIRLGCAQMPDTTTVRPTVVSDERKDGGKLILQLETNYFLEYSRKYSDPKANEFTLVFITGGKRESIPLYPRVSLELSH